MNQEKRTSTSPIPYLFSQTWKYSAGRRHRVILLFGLFICANSWTQIMQPLVFSSIMNKVQQEGITPNNLWGLIGLLLLIPLADAIFWFMHGPARVIECLNAFHTEKDYRRHLLRGVLSLSTEWHNEHHTGDTIDKMRKGESALYQFSSKMFQIVSIGVQLTVCVLLLTYFSPASGAVVIVMILLAGWISLRFDVVLKTLHKDINRAENKIAEGVTDAISNIITVITLRVERAIFDNLAELMRHHYPTYRRLIKTNETKWFVVAMCNAVMTALALGIYFYQHTGTNQVILAGNVYLLFAYLQQISQRIFNFANIYGDIMTQHHKVMNAEEIADDFKEGQMVERQLPTNWQTIRIEKLNFSYQDSTTPQLRVDDLTIRRGERIAVVGPSGGGKSTFLKTIRDLLQPQTLTLSVDGQPIKDGFAGICHAITLAPQDPQIFAQTLKINYTLGANHHQDNLNKCIKMSCTEELLKKLPKHLETRANEDGVNLSGGEKQRVALGRALLAALDKSDKSCGESVLLLDEPTSSVDPVTDLEIHDQIFKDFSEMTLIASVHKPYLLKYFPRIIVIDGGRVVGSGSVEQLLSSCPEFQALYANQNQNPS